LKITLHRRLATLVMLDTKMPIKVKQPDGTVKVVSIKKAPAGNGIHAARALAELPMCKDCGKFKVTGPKMKYCEACK
jgi:hypothetical protein